MNTRSWFSMLLRCHELAETHCISFRSHVTAASRRPSRRPGAAGAGGGAGSALGFVRRRLVELTGLAAVPRLGLPGVHAPAAQLTSLRASAAHARLGRVEIAYQGFSLRYGFTFSLISLTLLVDHRLQVFHSAWHVLVRRADGRDLTESHQVDLSDGDLREDAPQVCRLRPPLHRHGHVYFKPV
jgi:hypothetical protein